MAVAQKETLQEIAPLLLLILMLLLLAGWSNSVHINSTALLEAAGGVFVYDSHVIHIDLLFFHTFTHTLPSFPLKKSKESEN